jgi:hypothetical protein
MAGVKRDSMSDAEFGAFLCRKFDEYSEHHEAGRLGDDAPGAHEIVNQLSAGIRAGRAARDDNSGLGPVTIQKRGTPAAEGQDEPATSNIDPQASDDPPEFPGKPANPVNRNNRPAQDRALTVEEVARQHRQLVADTSKIELEPDGITVRVRKRF